MFPRSEQYAALTAGTIYSAREHNGWTNYRPGLRSRPRTAPNRQPPGQHAHFPLGGDRAASPGAKTSGGGAAVGAAVGGAVGLGVGLVATPVVGPLAVPAAAGVGAYVGSLAGALGKMDDPADTNPYEETPQEIRHAGVMVAAHVPEAAQRACALAVLQASRAQEIETADGQWRNGTWVDFDPIVPPGAEPGGPLAAARPERIRKQAGAPRFDLRILPATLGRNVPRGPSPRPPRAVIGVVACPCRPVAAPD